MGASISNSEFLAGVHSGRLATRYIVNKFGRNPSVPNGSWVPVTGLGTNNWQLSAQTGVRIKAGGDATDTAAGSGAREVTVQGLDNGGHEVTDTLATAGASASSSSSIAFFRVNRAWVSSTGTYAGNNDGDIVIENSAGGTDLLKITAGEGQSQVLCWSVPSSHSATILGLKAYVDSNKAADIRLMVNDNPFDVLTPFSASRVKMYYDGVSGSLPDDPVAPYGYYEGPADIWVEALGDGAVASVSGRIDLYVNSGS